MLSVSLVAERMLQQVSSSVLTISVSLLKPSWIQLTWISSPESVSRVVTSSYRQVRELLPRSKEK